MDIAIKVALGAVGYFILAIPIALFMGRTASTKWHPDKGRGVGDRH